MQIASISISWKCTFSLSIAKFSTSDGGPSIHLSRFSPPREHKTPVSDFIEKHTLLCAYQHIVRENSLFSPCSELCHWFMWKEEENYHGQDVWNWVGVWCIVCLGLAVMRFRQYQLWVADIPFIMNRLPEVIVFFPSDGYDTRYAG